MSRLLDADEITRQLADLPGWTGDTANLSHRVTAPTFVAAIRIVDEVAEVAEEMDHHPDIDIRWRIVRIALTTHDDGGLSAKDFALAAQIDDTFTVG